MNAEHQFVKLYIIIVNICREGLCAGNRSCGVSTVPTHMPSAGHIFVYSNPKPPPLCTWV